mgnify:CR=1 FL=1
MAAWATSTVRTEGVPTDQEEAFRAQVQPFVTWVAEAESESDDDEDDDE